MNTRCLVCDSVRLARCVSLDGGAREVLRCADCALEFVHPFILGQWGEAASVTADSYVTDLHQFTEEKQALARRRAARRLELYTRLLGGQPPQRILDVGAGGGWMVWALGQHGVACSGVEIDDQYRGQWQALGVDILHADICRLDISRVPSYDVVCSSQVLEHIFAPRDFCHTLSSLLRPGGLVHIDVPNGSSWLARVRRLRRHERRYGAIILPHHQTAYRPRTLQTLLEDANLRVLSVLEPPVDDPTLGQVIVPPSKLYRAYCTACRLLGHGYLLVGLGLKRSWSG